jgi:hypothetical protein
MRWRLLLEEYGPDIRHISGVENVVADAISRLPMAQNDENESSTSKILGGGRYAVLRLIQLLLPL